MFTTRKAPPLGQLELRVLDTIWRLGSGDAKCLQTRLEGHHAVSLSTIQSTLERLVRKELLARSKLGHAYIYKPAITRENLIARMIQNVVSELSQGDIQPALSGLIDLADPVDGQTLERLERMIAERRKARAGDGNV